MTINNDLVINNNEDSSDSPSLVMTDSAKILLQSIEDILAELVGRNDLWPSDDEFYNKFCTFLDLYDRCLSEVTDASGISAVCGAGCSSCCCHWVEDVNSFEGIIIRRYLKEHHPEIIDSAAASFRKDSEILTSLCVLVEEKIAEYSSGSDEIPDPYDLLLSCFYQLERPCAFLDGNGRCIVYPVRPLTCRDFINLLDPAACLPDRINGDELATLILYLSDTVSEHLEILHRRFDDGSDDKSLRLIFVRFPGSENKSSV